jgi:hypothetical protein
MQDAVDKLAEKAKTCLEDLEQARSKVSTLELANAASEEKLEESEVERIVSQ